MTTQTTIRHPNQESPNLQFDRLMQTTPTCPCCGRVTAYGELCSQCFSLKMKVHD